MHIYRSFGSAPKTVITLWTADGTNQVRIDK